MVLFFVLIGIIAGFLAGLLGIGGGIVTVPALLILFNSYDIYPTQAMQVAVGTSLGAMVFTSLSSSISHVLKKGVKWEIFWFLTPGVILGTMLGALIAHLLPNKQLQNVFGFFAILLGLRFLLSQYITNKEQKEIKLQRIIFTFAGTIIGTISVIMGIGGAIMNVPLLTHYRIPIRNAISTAATVGAVISCFGALFFAVFGLKAQGHNGFIGYIDITASIIIGLVSIVIAPFGAKLTYILPAHLLKKIFGIYLIIVGISFFMT